MIGFYAAMRLGAIVVNTNPMYTEDEIRHSFADSGCETVILFSGAYQRLKRIQEATKVKNVIVADVSDYIPAPWQRLVRRRIRRNGLLADVPEGPGVYRFRNLVAAHPERNRPRSRLAPAIRQCSSTRAAPRVCPRPPCFRIVTWSTTSCSFGNGVAASTTAWKS